MQISRASGVGATLPGQRSLVVMLQIPVEGLGESERNQPHNNMPSTTFTVHRIQSPSMHHSVAICSDLSRHITP